MISIIDFTITSLETIKAYSLDGVPQFILDELQDATISQTQDKEDITGKGGRKLSSLKKNKAVTISGTNGLMSSGLLEAQTGGKFEEKESTPISWNEVLKISSDEAVTSFKAVGTAGAEIEALYIRNNDGTAGTALEQAASAAEGKFAYNPATKKLTFNADDYEDNTEIIVFYTRNIAGNVLVNKSDNYSKILHVFIDAMGEDKCGNTYRVQFDIPKADFNGEFEIAMGDTQTVHAFEIEALSGACGTAGELWTYTVFGANAEDAAA